MHCDAMTTAVSLRNGATWTPFLESDAQTNTSIISVVWDPRVLADDMQILNCVSNTQKMGSFGAIVCVEEETTRGVYEGHFLIFFNFPNIGVLKSLFQKRVFNIFYNLYTVSYRVISKLEQSSLLLSSHFLLGLHVCWYHSYCPYMWTLRPKILGDSERSPKPIWSTCL